jgi:hypothetical protein
MQGGVPGMPAGAITGRTSDHPWRPSRAKVARSQAADSGGLVERNLLSSSPAMSSDEDDLLSQTTPFSVATLRTLISRSADMSPERRPARRSSPLIDVLTKGPAVLVFPDTMFPASMPPLPLGAAPLADPIPRRAPLAAPVERSPVASEVRPAPRPAQLPPLPVRHARRKRDSLAHVGAFLRCRLVALTLLTAAVVAPPSWWNVGEVEPAPAWVIARAARANAPAAAAANAETRASAR